MKKKFKIIDASSGEKIKLGENQMLVMNNQGIFFVVNDMFGYDCHVDKLSDVCPKYEVIWKGEE